VIKLSSDIVVQAACTVTSINILSSSATCSPDTTLNTITILNSLSSEYQLVTGEYIKFTVSGIRMPASIAPSGTTSF
jgi:hypothetical protein